MPLQPISALVISSKRRIVNIIRLLVTSQWLQMYWQHGWISKIFIQLIILPCVWVQYFQCVWVQYFQCVWVQYFQWHSIFQYFNHCRLPSITIDYPRLLLITLDYVKLKLNKITFCNYNCLFTNIQYVLQHWHY